MHGGPLLGLRSQQFICFYDWSEARLVRRVDVSAQQVFWSDNGELLAITTDSAFYVLRYARDRIQKTLDSGQVRLQFKSIIFLFFWGGSRSATPRILHA
jgi:coatomer subunit beta'